jgi:hypothetical protein
MKTGPVARGSRTSRSRSTAESLKAFLRRRAPANTTGGADRAAMRAEWRVAVEHLLDRLLSWLAPLEAQGLVATERHQGPRIEPLLGTYTVSELQIHFVGHPSVRIHSAARLVVGAKGRVDMSCGPRYLMLLRKGSGQWRIESPDESAPPAKLNRATFEQALRRLIASGP